MWPEGAALWFSPDRRQLWLSSLTHLSPTVSVSAVSPFLYFLSQTLPHQLFPLGCSSSSSWLLISSFLDSQLSLDIAYVKLPMLNTNIMKERIDVFPLSFIYCNPSYLFLIWAPWVNQSDWSKICRPHDPECKCILNEKQIKCAKLHAQANRLLLVCGRVVGDQLKDVRANNNRCKHGRGSAI